MRYVLLASVASLMTVGCDEIKSQMDSASSKAEGKPAAHQMTANKDRLEADVRYLADDLLEGREAGTRGYDLAARYVAERYRAIGLEPGGPDGSYYQQVPMREVRAADPTGGTLTLSGANAPAAFVKGEDYLVGSSAKAAEAVVEAPMVFVGFGLVAEEYDRDDFAGLDVDGKIVVYLPGAPKFLGSEERAHYSSTTSQRASERGAVGTIRLYTPDREKRFSFSRIAHYLATSTGMSWMKEDGTPFSQTPNIKAGATVSLKGAEALFANAPTQWAEIVTALEDEQGDVKGFDMNMTGRLETSSIHRALSSPNVVGVMRGSDPKLRDEYIVLTGHLDHVGIQKTDEEGDDELHNGAMDNASGVASMLEVATLLAHNPPKRSLIFVSLTAEEKGLVGSDYFAQNPTVPADQVVANINLDMPVLTYEFSDVVAFGGERSTMYPVVEAAAKRAGLTLSPDPQPEQGFFTRSDQYSFVKQGIPAVYLDLGFGNNGEEAQGEFFKKHYHKPSDEVEVMDMEALRRFAQVNYEIADGVGNMPVRPLWKKGDFFATMFDGPMEE
ncbi:MAG: aminopeptidase [Hyphococcus sp.]|nr:MAG: aminopeptidase [Marinicaulis sp.]